MTEYVIEVLQLDSADRLGELRDAIAHELSGLGLHRSVTVELVDSVEDPVGSAFSVFLGSERSALDPALNERVGRSLASADLVIPVVESLTGFHSQVPATLHPLNAIEWVRGASANPLARRLLEELAIEERQRRVFISHKRDDGLLAAEQLHDHLSHHGFRPFIDRFGVAPGRDLQAEIANAMEDCAFLLLLETPLAHTSDWVFDEVEYAQSHQMGIHIVTWPGDVEELPLTNRWPRQQLGVAGLRREKGFDILTDEALDGVLEEVEAIHAQALARRRRYLLKSTEEAARAAGMQCTPLAGWRLLVESADAATVVQVSPRLPTVEELCRLDAARLAAREGGLPGLLVHAARALSRGRRETLAWAAGGRDLSLLPENAVGGYWS